MYQIDTDLGDIKLKLIYYGHKFGKLVVLAGRVRGVVARQRLPIEKIWSVRKKWPSKKGGHFVMVVEKQGVYCI